MTIAGNKNCKSIFSFFIDVGSYMSFDGEDGGGGGGGEGGGGKSIFLFIDVGSYMSSSGDGVEDGGGGGGDDALLRGGKGGRW